MNINEDKKNVNSTRLFTLEPAALFSPLSESLPSYIMRLAKAHHVTVGNLAKNEIIPRLSLDYYLLDGRTSNFYLETKRLYSSSVLSNELIRALEELTGNNNLQYLKADINPFIKQNRAFRNIRAWCPHCLQEWRDNGGIVYEPLLWNFSIIEYCIRHKYPLQTKCNNCGQQMKLLTPTSIPGFCSKCRAWLGGNNDSSIGQIKNYDWHLWVYNNITELLCERSIIKNNNFLSINIQRIVVTHFKSLRKFSLFIGIPYLTLYSWIKENVRPSLNILLEMSYCIDVKIIRLITEEIHIYEIEKITFKEPVIKHLSAHRTINWDLCEQELNTALKNEFPPSIQELARRLSVNVESIRVHLPEKVCEIVLKRKEYISNKTRQKRIRQQEELRRIMIEIYKQGKYPTIRAVSDQLGIKGWLLKESANYEVWINTLISLGLTVR
ncbi:TniQ family protein [Desulfosporosinus sp. SYSU MS00001]|uniref:TniQ family protein n=1 Tax=Desulfosporosinus sp. SYSU MS00001 TaxID=3416284 RepID=UPI003CEF74F7